jgi:hypothetical protein
MYRITTSIYVMSTASEPNQYEATNRVGFCPNPDLAR